MRLLITGGAGFIGSALVRRAVSDGHHVLNVDKLTYAANLASVSEVADQPNYRFVEADICDAASVKAALDSFVPDVVFNLAAETHVDRSIDGSDEFIRTNVNGVHTLLEACRAWQAKPEGFRFIQVSTDEVFGSIDKGGFTETSRYKPSSPYSASKAAADHLVRAWHSTYDFPSIITNCSNNYGPHQFPEKFIPTVILKALRGETIPLYGDGQQVRDWLYVDDHADALLTVAQKGVLGETYCIGGGHTPTNLDLARTVCALVDERLPETRGSTSADLIKRVADRPGHDRRYAIDFSRIKRELGWSPRMTLEQGLAQTVDWYMNNEDWLHALVDQGKAGQRLGTAKTAEASS